LRFQNTPSIWCPSTINMKTYFVRLSNEEAPWV
jgi:hypothetical protein